MEEAKQGDKKNGRSIPEASIDTMLIYNILKDVVPGGIVSKDDIVAKLGRPYEAIRPNVDSARRIAQRDNQMVFGPVRGVGLKRLSDQEISEEGCSLAEKTRRAARRSKKKLQCVNVEQLDRTEVNRLYVSMSMVSFLGNMTAKKRLTQVEAAVVQSQERLPIGKTLELFKN